MPGSISEIKALLPEIYRAALDRLPENDLNQVEEIRLRRGKTASILLRGRECALPLATNERVCAQTIQHVLNRATEYSAYAVAEELAAGFLTIPGGHRIGVCGTAVLRDGQISTIRDVSSLCIRIARPVEHIAGTLAKRLFETGKSALILGPPGSGKTTLLRDTVRTLSDQYDQRVCIVDERGELAAVRNGEPQLPIGRRTDVLSLCPKAQGIALCLRSMNPQWIAVDEITCEADVLAIGKAAYCGVGLLASAHADNLQDFSRRKLYQDLLSLSFFEHFYVLSPAREGHFEEWKP